MDLGRVGVWSGELSRLPADSGRAAARLIEELGFQTCWYPEAVTKEALSQAAVLLAATDRLGIATGIANIWVRDATTAINGARTIVDAFGNRFVLGLGVSHQPTVDAWGHDYKQPLRAMREYLAAMAAAVYRGAGGDAEIPIVLAALGPKMLELARDSTLGAHPYFVPVEHTFYARERLGHDALLAPEQAVLLSRDPSEARARARKHTTFYLRLANYRRNLERLGFAEDEFADGGSDHLVDSIVAWGDVDAIQARVADHLDAGADHVAIQVLPTSADAFPTGDLRALAPALLEL